MSRIRLNGIVALAAMMGAGTAISPSGQTVHLPPDRAPAPPRKYPAGQPKVGKVTRQLRRQAERTAKKRAERALRGK